MNESVNDVNEPPSSDSLPSLSWCRGCGGLPGNPLFVVRSNSELRGLLDIIPKKSLNIVWSTCSPRAGLGEAAVGVDATEWACAHRLACGRLQPQISLAGTPKSFPWLQLLRFRCGARCTPIQY